MSVAVLEKSRTFEIWDVLNTGEGLNMSLPEYFINKPSDFLCEFMRADGDYDQDYGEHHDGILNLACEMIGNIGHIQLPLRLRRKMSVVEIIDPPRPYYFEIATFESIKKIYSSLANFNIRQHIDFVNPYFDGVEPGDLKHAVNHMIDAYEGQKASLWEKWQCEAFFANKRNFVAKRNRVPNSYELLLSGSYVCD